MWFTTQKNRISHYQVAFKKSHSTMDALLRFQHFASKALSTKNHVSILATDFEKAFDRVGLHSVLYQLVLWGVGPRLYNLIKAFMTNRTFRVRVNNSTSNLHKLHNGIPQGSPLSVVLFMIAFEQISSIFNRHKDISISLYADDAFIYTNKKDLNSVKDTFSNVLDELEQWGASSGASLSIEKCQVLHFCRKQNCNFPEIGFNNKIMQQTNHLKILGITFDSRFTFKEHCLRLRNQLESRLNIVKFLSSKCIY